MNIADLKAGLDFYKNLGGREGFVNEFLVLEQAARTIALPILEADPELVERIANCLRSYVVQVDTDRAWILFARAVLAAISTPTPVESE